MATCGRVLLVGFPPEMRSGFEAALLPEHKVCSADNCEAAKETLREDIDVVVIDDSQATWLALLSLARRANSYTLALVLTDDLTRPALQQAQEAGLVVRALRKPVSLPHLIALAINSIGLATLQRARLRHPPLRTPYRVVVLDQHAAMRGGYVPHTSAPEVEVDWTADVASFIEELSSAPHQLAVIDADGVASVDALIERVREAQRDGPTPIVIVTSDELVLRTDGFVSIRKPVSLNQILLGKAGGAG